MRLQRNLYTTRNKVYILEEYIDIFEIDDNSWFMFIIFPNQGKHFVRHHDIYFTVLFSSDLYLIKTDALGRAGKHFVKV